MFARIPPPVRPPPSPFRFLRVEYLDFQNVADDREFRFGVHGPDGSTEVRLRIPIAAFGAVRLRLQDGPDVCYQKLLRSVAAGEAPGGHVITIDDAELASYRDAHTPVTKHRSRPPIPASSEPFEPRTPPRMQVRLPPRPQPPPPVAPPVEKDAAPMLEEGQRVRHAVFGIGVTTKASRSHTVVRFDQDGPMTFVTSMLKVDVLSAPHTWEAGPRGVNRPCR